MRYLWPAYLVGRSWWCDIVKYKSMSKTARSSRIKKIFVWIFLLILTALITAIITWHVTKTFTEQDKTKVYNYIYVSDTSTDHSDGKAECWVNGAGGRDDSYKCSQDNSIYAPCFQDMKDISSQVKCPRSPTSDLGAKYFIATFSDEIDPAMSSFGEDPTPWFIKLSSGEECRFTYGATSVVANRRVDFSCKDSPVSLLLPMSDEAGIYRIGCMKNSRLEECLVKEMWK